MFEMALKRRRKTKHRKASPDDYFQSGPIEFARFGKVVVSRNRATAEQFKAVQANMAGELPRIIAEIDSLVATIAKQVASLPPERLLQRAWWEFAASVIDLGGQPAGEFEDPVVLRMIDYVQSVIAAVPPAPSSSEDVTDQAWAALKENVSKLFERLNVEYQMALTARRRAQDPNLDMGDSKSFDSGACRHMWKTAGFGQVRGCCAVALRFASGRMHHPGAQILPWNTLK